MLHIIAWTAVYALILAGLSPTVSAWRGERWFKLAFLPGSLLALGVQVLCALLCLGRDFEVDPFGRGRPVFRMGNQRVPWLAGALFVFLSHLAVYILFLFTVAELEGLSAMCTDVTCLPELQPHEMLEGRFELEVTEYLESLDVTWAAVCESPFSYGLLFYLAAGVFASLRVGGRECFWCVILVVTLGFVTYCADYLEMGFPFLSRGWWASWFYFPRWWGLFSLWLTLALGCFIGFAVARLATNLVLSFLPPRPEEGERNKTALPTSRDRRTTTRSR